MNMSGEWNIQLGEIIVVFKVTSIDLPLVKMYMIWKTVKISWKNLEVWYCPCLIERKSSLSFGTSWIRQWT